ncbi:MAG: guanylate kinase [Planctomycetes bacterium]|nr:guanylate kinase [Planctomycetota bacterium]
MTVPLAGFLVVLSGPSGVGKSSVAAQLVGDPRFGRAVTATTRAPRAGERDGVDYHFFTTERFNDAIAHDEFIEHAKVHGNLYGTPKSSVRRVIEAGKACLLVIDVQGAATLRHQGEDALFVFLAPPSEAALQTRLRSRGTEPPGQLELRIRNALQEELPRAREFDHVVVNDDLARAVAEITLLVSHRRAQPSR